MKKSTLKRLTATAGASIPLLALSLFGSSSASASACVGGSVTEYTTSGFSCTVGDLTFSDFKVTTTGDVNDSSLTAFEPYTSGNENGFQLSYSANASPGADSDISVTYTVMSAPGSMVDVYASLTGVQADGGKISLGETLSNGVTLSITGPGIASATFSPTNSLTAIKDVNGYAPGEDSTATSSVLVNAFSLQSVPEPGTIALFGAGLLGCALFLRRRRPNV